MRKLQGSALLFCGLAFLLHEKIMRPYSRLLTHVVEIMIRRVRVHCSQGALLFYPSWRYWGHERAGYYLAGSPLLLLWQNKMWSGVFPVYQLWKFHLYENWITDTTRYTSTSHSRFNLIMKYVPCKSNCENAIFNETNNEIIMTDSHYVII